MSKLNKAFIRAYQQPSSHSNEQSEFTLRLDQPHAVGKDDLMHSIHTIEDSIAEALSNAPSGQHGASNSASESGTSGRMDLAHVLQWYESASLDVHGRLDNRHNVLPAPKMLARTPHDGVPIQAGNGTDKTLGQEADTPASERESIEQEKSFGNRSSQSAPDASPGVQSEERFMRVDPMPSATEDSLRLAPFEPAFKIPTSTQAITSPPGSGLSTSTTDMVSESEIQAASVAESIGRPKRNPLPPSASPTHGASSRERQDIEQKLRDEQRILSIQEQNSKSQPSKGFLPEWEVDQLQWPEITNELCSSQHSTLDEVAAHLIEANSTGLSTMAITSLCVGRGSSTVAMCLARVVARSGLRVALVDADPDGEPLADALNLDVEQGWLDCVTKGSRVEEAAIHSIDDGVTVFPMLGTTNSPRIPLLPAALENLLQAMQGHYDLVLFDAQKMDQKHCVLTRGNTGNFIQAAIVVIDPEEAESAGLESAVEQLQNLEISSVGIVENVTIVPSS